MLIANSLLSVLLLAASAIPSVTAEREPKESTKIVWRTLHHTKYKFNFVETTTIMKFDKTSTLTKTRTIMKPRKIVTYSVTKVTTRYIKVAALTETTTVTNCPTTKMTTEKDPFSTCPPASVVTVDGDCDPDKPECPSSKRCAVQPGKIYYNCNCATAPPRTITVTRRCPEACCGGYIRPNYNLLARPNDPNCEALKKSASPKQAPIIEPEEEEVEEPAEPEQADDAEKEDGDEGNDDKAPPAPEDEEAAVAEASEEKDAAIERAKLPVDDN